MALQDFMAKVRQWDNRSARWMMRHFYIIFFEFVLVIVFFIFFFNVFKSLDISSQVPREDLTAQVLVQQNINQKIIIVLLLLNSFWMLYIFNGMQRIRIILKEISYNLMRSKPGRNS